MSRGIYRSAAGERAIRAWCEEQLAHSTARRTTHQTVLGPTETVEFGRADSTVVFVAGTSLNSATWLPVLEEASLSHHVIGIDVPGQPGLSCSLRPADTARAYGHWLVEIAAALDTGSVTLVGHSFGARIALEAALVMPDLIDRLVLVSPAGIVPVRPSPRAVGPVLAWLTRPSPDSARRLVRVMTGTDPPALPGLVEWLALVGRHVRPPSPAALGSAQALAPLSTDDLRSVKSETVVISGALDCFVRSTRLARRLATTMPAALSIDPRGGHLLPHEHPELVLGLIPTQRTL